MSKSDARRIVIIGGVAAGAKTASKARREDPGADIRIYTQEEYISYAGCGEPYYIADEFHEKSKLLARSPEQFDSHYDIQVHTRHKVTSIDPATQTIGVEDLSSGREFSVPYDSLVIATGARPFVPPIPGIDLPGVHVLRTLPDTYAIREQVDSGTVKRAVVVGAGFIGLEMVESFVGRGIAVTLVERAKQVAPPYDEDVADHITKTLNENHVDVRVGAALESIQGDEKTGVTSVTINGEELPCELVLLSVGVRPNVELAAEAGVTLGTTGAIAVNERMETSVPNVYAAGDCVECIHRVSGKPVWVPLGSTANRQGRVLGINITGGNARFEGILSTSIFRVFDLNVSRTGLIEREAEELGIDYEVAVVPMYEKPNYMPDAKKLIVKVLGEKGTNRFLGAQVWGQGNVDKVIDTAATALAFGAKVDDLAQLDLAYAPPFASALGNIITAGHVLLNKLEGSTEGITPRNVQKKQASKEPFVFVDVRNAAELKTVCLKETVNIPLHEIAARLGELPEDMEIITSCGVGLRAAQAYRVLRNHGRKAKYMDGGITAWTKPEKGPAQS